MSAHHPEQEPERLIDGELGSLLREANREFAIDFDQRAAFRRVTARLAASREQRLPAAARWLVPAAPFALAALAVVVVLVYERSPQPVPELVAETWQPRAQPSAAPPSAATAEGSSEEVPVRRGASKNEPPAAKLTPARASATASAPRDPSKSRSEPGPEPTPTPPEPSVASNQSPELEPPAKAPDCLSLARQGQTREAETCFLERARGSGLGAEMALYEVARLRRDVLADADGALGALAEYRRRFPSGSLRREADMSQLELLLQLGRSDDALKQSDELLSSSASGERAAELHLLRGHILRKQSRFDAATREYEQAEGAQASAGEATYFRALCLEAMGSAAPAAAAFAKYLERPQRPYAEDARHRLERLKP